MRMIILKTNVSTREASAKLQVLYVDLVIARIELENLQLVGGYGTSSNWHISIIQI